MKIEDYCLVPIKSLDETTKAFALSAIKLADASYEAGKMDKELSYMFDNPKGRFLNSEINLVD